MSKPIETRPIFRWDATHPFELRAQMVLADANMVAQRPNGQRAELPDDITQAGQPQVSQVTVLFV